MKNITILFASLVLITITGANAQEQIEKHIPLLGDEAPSFKGQSTMGDINFPGDYFAKWKIIYSHPADFTPVCTSELLELAELQKEFEKLNTAILVISTDGLNSHIEWVKSMESLNYNGRVTTKIDFPLISDPMKEISAKYGMIHSNSSTTKNVRAVYIVNPDNKIAAIFYYPMNIGRNMEEIKRTLIALQTSEKHNVFTPANWTPGEKVLIPAPSTKIEAEKMKVKDDPKITRISWYMWLKEI